MRHLPLLLAAALLSIPVSALAQDSHAGHTAPAGAPQTAAPGHESPAVPSPGEPAQLAGAQGSDLTALLGRIDQATGDEKVALMAEAIGRLVAAQGAGKCGGAGHSCPMCQAHKAR